MSVEMESLVTDLLSKCYYGRARGRSASAAQTGHAATDAGGVKLSRVRA